MSTPPRRPYRTDLSDTRWALIEPMLSAWPAGRVGLGISPIQHDLSEIVNAIRYVNRTGIAWGYLPHDFPPYVQDGARLLRLVGEGRCHRGPGQAQPGRPWRAGAPGSPRAATCRRRRDSPAAAFVSDALAHGPWRHRVRVRLHTSADLVRELVDPSVATVIDDGHECELRFGTDDLDWVARWLAYLNIDIDIDIDIVEPSSLTDRLRVLGCWLLDRY